MTKKEEYQKIANMVMNIDHVGVQCDDIHRCEEKHQAILALDKLDKHEAIRLLVHVIHVQQLKLSNSKIEYSQSSPFNDMDRFDHIENYVNSNDPSALSLY